MLRQEIRQFTTHQLAADDNHIASALHVAGEKLYGMYGVELYDQRISGTLPSSTEMSTPTNLTAFHNARFLAECAAAKARNINVFVIGFAQTLTPELTQCASPGQAFYASDNASLTAAFRKIAGAPGIHFYALNRAPATRAVLGALKASRPWERVRGNAGTLAPSAD